MDLQDVLQHLNDIDREARASIHPVRGAASALEELRALIADVEVAIGGEASGPASSARAMEVGEVRRVGGSADGHLIRHDEDAWLYAASAFATEHTLGAEEAEEVITGRSSDEEAP